jgi:hypothetical protein
MQTQWSLAPATTVIQITFTNPLRHFLKKEIHAQFVVLSGTTEAHRATLGEPSAQQNMHGKQLAKQAPLFFPGPAAARRSKRMRAYIG